MSATAGFCRRVVILNALTFNSFTAKGVKYICANSVDPDRMAHDGLSHQDLRCLIFSLSALHINFCPSRKHTYILWTPLNPTFIQ